MHATAFSSLAGLVNLLAADFKYWTFHSLPPKDMSGQTSCEILPARYSEPQTAYPEFAKRANEEDMLQRM